MARALSPGRLGAAVRRYGAVGVARQLAGRMRNLAYMEEQHVWYFLDLAHVPERALADGYRLLLATDEDVQRLGGLPSPVSVGEAERRRAKGTQLWLVLHGEEVAFTCWTFPRATPVWAARGHVLELPSGVACLEDLFTSASHRGHGIAGAACTVIARGLRGDGFEVLITKVEVGNVPARRAVSKAGFLEGCVMHLRRRGPRERVTIRREDVELSPAGEAASAELERSLAR